MIRGAFLFDGERFRAVRLAPGLCSLDQGLRDVGLGSVAGHRVELDVLTRREHAAALGDLLPALVGRVLAGGAASARTDVTELPEALHGSAGDLVQVFAERRATGAAGAPGDHYSDANGRIYEAALAFAGTPVDVVSVATWLRDRERLAQIGGPTYLAQLADLTPAVANVTHHARTVHEKWRLRCLAATCFRISADCYGDVGESTQQFVDGAEHDIYQIARSSETTRVQPVKVVLAAAFRQITEAAERGSRITGIPTGFEKLDAKIAGVHAGDLMIVAARPGMGKTSLCLDLAVNVASPRALDDDTQVEGYGVAFFSLEMPREQLAVRMVCSEGRVDVGKIRQGCLGPDDWRRLTEAASYLSSLPIWIDDTSALGILELRAKVRRIQAEYNREAIEADPARGVKAEPERKVGLVVVDYLQLMKGRDGVNSREQEISELSRGLKELSAPVIALSQLNRAVETRSKNDKRPQLSDLI